jgi:hypothetical protein
MLKGKNISLTPRNYSSIPEKTAKTLQNGCPEPTNILSGPTAYILQIAQSITTLKDPSCKPNKNGFTNQFPKTKTDPDSLKPSGAKGPGQNGK